MQVNLSIRNIVIIIVLAAAGWYAYQQYYGGLEGKDVGQLLALYPHETRKQAGIESRINSQYRPLKHYKIVAEALDAREPALRGLAVRVLTRNRAEQAVPKLRAMLSTPSTEHALRVDVAKAFQVFSTSKEALKAVPRLIELTAGREEPELRAAAHDSLLAILETNDVRYGDGMRERWQQYWLSHPKRRQR
jgi:hypothetical protein